MKYDTRRKRKSLRRSKNKSDSWSWKVNDYTKLIDELNSNIYYPDAWAFVKWVDLFKHPLSKKIHGQVDKLPFSFSVLLESLYLMYLNWCTEEYFQKNEMNIERGVPKNYARCHIIRSGSHFLNEKSNFYSLEDLVEKENKTHTFGLMRCWYHNVLIEEISTLSMSYFFGCISRVSTIMTWVALLIPSIIRWTWKISMNNIKNQKDWEMEQNERGGKKRFTEAHLIETLYES